MPIWATVSILFVGAIAALFGLDRLLLWMEKREWIYWRKRKPEGRGTLAVGLTSFQELIEPQIQHIAEDRREREAADKDEQGGPPGKLDNPLRLEIRKAKD